MSIYGVTPVAVVFEDEIQAPFAGFGDDTAERLLRMGVMDENDELYEDSIAILAATFTSNFIDRVMEYCKDEVDALETFFNSVDKLWKSKETTGLYFYLILSCGIVEYPVPKELIWIAQRDDALFIYMQKFIDAVQSYAVNEPDEN